MSAPKDPDSIARALNDVPFDRDGTAQVEVRHAEALMAFEAAADDAAAKVVAPFAEIFTALHAVALEDLPTSEALPELSQVDDDDRLDAVQMIQAFVIIAGQPELLRAAGTVTWRVLRDGPKILDTAVSLSEGATQSARIVHGGLPRAFAQSKDMARQVGRTAAKHPGWFALGTLAVWSASMAWAVRADNAERREREEAQKRRTLLDAEASRRSAIVDGLTRERLLVEAEHTQQAIQVLTRLTDIGLDKLPALRELVAGNDDYATYPQTDRLAVAELAGLTEVLVAVIARHKVREADVALPELPDGGGALGAAHAVLDRLEPARQPAGLDVAPSFGWAAGALNSAPQRNQLTYLLGEPEYLERLARRCGNAHQGVQDGFHFEWMHELSFNLDAIGKDSGLRARMTERLGRPGDPADIVIQSASGDTTRQVQAKVVGSRSQRIGPKNGLSDPKYRGMDLLVPTDHVQETHEFIDRARARPIENLYASGYEDAQSRVTDTIASGDISSDPISTGELTAVAKDPTSFIQRLVADTRKRQALSSGIAAGGAATVMSLAADTTQQLLIEGHLDGLNWVQAAVSAARTGAASAIAASGGSYLQTGAQLAVNDGTANWLQTSLSHGDHGPALSRAAVDVAAIAHGFVTDRLTAEEAAKAIAQTVLESAVIWACTAAARRVIPNAEIAALVGGIVGQIGTQIVLQGLKTAWLGRDQSEQWNAAYEGLLADTAALELACSAEQRELAFLAEECRTRFADRVLPALDRLDSGAHGAERESQSTEALRPFEELAAIASHFGRAPMFSDLDAFDTFMADPTTTLALDLARR